MEDCIFCKIAKKEIPSHVVYEDEHVIAFDDLHPVAPVHTLVIPKVHISNMMELTEDEFFILGKIHLAIQEVAKIKGVSEKGKGFRVITNYGEDGGQTIHHLHYHVIGGRHLGPKIIHDKK